MAPPSVKNKYLDLAIKKAQVGNRQTLFKLLSVGIAAGFSTLFSQVAGLHRAFPSTTLDKVFNFQLEIIYRLD